MKAKLSYKSKRNIIISAIIIALLAIIAVATYFFIKGNNDSSAAFTQNNAQVGESGQTETQGNEGQDAQKTVDNQGQNGEQTQTPEQMPTENNNGETTGNNEGITNSSNTGSTTQGQNGTTNNATTNNGTSNNGTSNNRSTNNANTGMTTGTTTTNVPNEEYVTERIEEEEVLVSEDYMVEWKPLSIEASTTTANLSIIRPIITAQKATNKSTVVPGEEITYTITVKNAGLIDGVAIVQDSAPVEPVKTTFKPESIKINGEHATKILEDAKVDDAETEKGKEVALTEQDLIDGISVNVPAEGEATVSFTVIVDKATTDTEKVEGTVENTAKVNDKETNPVYNPIITYQKKVDRKTVKAGEKIEYTIEVKNTGNQDGTAIVFDRAPEGTTFETESIKINGKPATKVVEDEETEQEVALTEQDLMEGITIDLPAEEMATVSFIVIPNEDLEDGYIINNTAYINHEDKGGETNQVTTIYQKPIIKSEKVTNKQTVIPGEEITYTITVINTGSTEGTALVTDSAPTEPVKTTFKNGSIKITGTDKIMVGENEISKSDINTLTEQDLINGIHVNVPALTGEVKVSFTVTVDKPTTDTEKVEGIVENTAKVNDKETNTVYNPIITYRKEVDKTVARIENELTYKIIVKNTGSQDGTAVVFDRAPEDTTFKKGSIKINGEPATKVVEEKEVALTEQDLINGIRVNVPAEGETAVSFTVTVDKAIKKSPVKNTAKINNKEDRPNKENETNTVTTKIITDYRVEHYYEGKIYTPHTDSEGPEFKGIEIGTIKDSYLQKPNIEKEDGTVEKYKFISDTLSDGLTLVGDPEKNVIKVYYQKPVLDVTKSSSKAEATYNEEITYTIKVENTTKVDTTINVHDEIPEEVNFVNDSIRLSGNVDTKAEYGYNTKTREITYKGKLQGTKTLTLKFKATVNEKAQSKMNTGIKNEVTVTEECGGSYGDETETKLTKSATVEVGKTLDLVLVLDCSNSMENSMDDLKTAAKGTVNQLFDASSDSTISLVSYGSKVTTHGTFKNTTNDKQLLLNKIDGLQLASMTNIKKAVEATNGVLSNLPANRKKVVLFMSDGAPTYYGNNPNSPEVKLITESGNTNWQNPAWDWDVGNLDDNTRQNITAQIAKLKNYKKTTVYSVGFNVADLRNDFIQYAEEVGAYSNQTGANDIFYQKKVKTYNGKQYYYISEKDYAEYVLKNISTSSSYISTSNLTTTFNNIMKELLEPAKTYTAKGTDTIKMPETRTIKGKVTVTIGKSTKLYTLAELQKGVNGLTYTTNKGFEWKINQDRFTKTLKIKYEVDA